ncbi:hypothetical protein HQ531_13115 [bacterium]|nr:hypothetical protein [bacterium]
MIPAVSTRASEDNSSALPDIWLKAAMLGSLWASVEIILGSFLHNLHIPFSGTFLAALSVILMINGYKLWPEKGLFWRTALVCAAMKSISPSAIIFGPMIGIFMEGFVLEVFVRLFRGRWLGFVIGGAFAVSWSLFQKIFVMLMTYGPDFVKLYEQLYFMAARSLRFESAVPFDLVKAIFVIDLSFGALVALLALRTNSRQKEQILRAPKDSANSQPENLLAASTSQKYSVILFFINLGVLLTGLIFLNDVSLVVGMSLVVTYVTLNIARYARSLKRLKRPQLWIQLTAIMGLSGLILGGWDSQAAILNGLETGLGMATRALLVIFGFSALSIEIRNPVIFEWFRRRGLGVLFKSLSLAFEVLPHLLKIVSGKRRIWRHPFITLNQLLGSLEGLRRRHTNTRSKVLIITGEQGGGKTTMIKNLLMSKELENLTFSGFYTEGTWRDSQRDKYRIVDIKSAESVLLCERGEPGLQLRSGPFNFNNAGIDFGCQILKSIPRQTSSIVIMDEIGPLEIQDEGWSTYIQELIESKQTMIWTVRPSLIDSVVAKWQVDADLCDINQHSFYEIATRINTILI